MNKRGISAVTLLLALILGCCGAQAEGETPAAPAIGSYIILGSYEQDNISDNGSEPIEWEVLDVQGNVALLMSRYALNCQPFSADKSSTAWEQSALRTWLNQSFIGDTFTEDERAILLTSSTPTDAPDGSGPVAAGSDVDDRVFILSQAEVTALKPDKKARKVEGTEYAREQGAKFLGVTSIGIGQTDWWLRSPGEKEGQVACVNVMGDIAGRKPDDDIGVRPVIRIDWTVDTSASPGAQYARAAAMQADGQYEEAAQLFEALGNYSDSEDRVKECRYQLALAAVEAGDDSTAFGLFEALDGYSDSYVQARACSYRIAVALQEAGDYEGAIEQFGKVGQYEDSMERLKQCYDKCGISVYYFSQDPVKAGFNNGYSKAETIDGKDAHFGWRMGRFFMSGFTRVNGEGGDNPLFIKTLGDTLTLWFDLEQDIDSLNGNEKLSVGEDDNGYDESFGVPKTNFGRGTLIVRHTDYQNSKSDPLIYTDYLLAKGTSGADTKVVLQEEGDYEVALDYELQDDDIKHIASKFGDYRVLLKFSIRNGNCMVYPFDVLTGEELQNTAITENGFSLDLARSRYLDINVKRSVMVEGASGIVEDERFNRPAKDGDQYTQEGIYTISVSNRYTGESTTKTIFVGTDELLDEYIANGFSEELLES